MGKHVNAEAGSDDAEAAEEAESQHEAARHVADAGHPLEPQAVISADTHVGIEFDQVAPGTPDAAPSPANPDSLIEHGLVGDGHELE